MMEEIEMKPTTGNIFADIGVDNPEEYLAKARLAYQINEIIKQRQLKQKAAAELLGIDQPKISDLARGQLTGFSMTRLINFLNMLDQDVEIIVKLSLLKNGAGGHLTVQLVFSTAGINSTGRGK